MDIKISFDDRAVEKSLSTLTTGLKNLEKPLGGVGDALVGYYGGNVFKTQGKAAGDAWRPLSSATLLMRQARVGHYAKRPIATDKILIWTGRLQRGFRKTLGKNKVTIDNPVPYFKDHQLGTKAPKRPMLAITKDVIKIVVDDLNAYLKKILR